MYVLGMNGSPNPVNDNPFNIEEGIYHDSAAALLHKGKIVAAIEEERLNRIKHSNKWPVMAANACLKAYGASFGQMDCFALSTSEESIKHMLSAYFKNSGIRVPGAHYFIQQLLEDYFQIKISIDKIELFEHHYVHAVTAFYPSPFKEALVLTIDGSGGEYSGSVYDGRQNQLTPLKAFQVNQSLGNFYLYVTCLLGFRIFDEYKVMGLAPYGNPATYRNLFEELYSLLPEGNYEIYTAKAARLGDIIPPNTSGFSQVHKDIAASLQETLEKIVFHIVRYFKQVTGSSNLCLAGGVALNCTLNGKLIQSGLFEDVFVYPGSNDSGMPVGAALAGYFKRCSQPERIRQKNVCLGREVGNDHFITSQLDQWRPFINYSRMGDITLAAAELLADDKVIGWVQGRSEFGPRALGNRSILADPRPQENKERINAIVKKREGFRPFAPSVLEEFAAEYFEISGKDTDYSYMTFVVDVKEKYRHLLGAITHVDGTARVQTVSKDDNPKYWELISRFMHLTGTPVLLNTSFNNNAEPIVDSVLDAVVCFLTTRLDFLIIGDFLIEKLPFPVEQLSALYPSLPPYMKLKRKEKKLANTFNEKSLDLSDLLLKALSAINGEMKIGEILEDLQIDDAGQKMQLLDQFLGLWEKRMIILDPSGKTPVAKYMPFTTR